MVHDLADKSCMFEAPEKWCNKYYTSFSPVKIVF